MIMASERLEWKVHELIKDPREREKFFNALRHYQSGHDLSMLLEDAQQVLDEPSKLELFEHMRPLVLLNHQIEYSQRLSSILDVKARIVRLHRRAGEELGFAVRGGLEHGVGVFVTDVVPGSQAARQGLLISDEIITVNGFTISEAIHNDVLNLIKARDDIVLKVKQIGMLPVKEDPRTAVTWKYAREGFHHDVNGFHKPKDLKIFVDGTGHPSLGCGILSGPPHLPGIFVESVTPDSVAYQVNLEPGDQIVEVNGTTFHRITHKEAVHALVSSRQLNITIRKGVGIELMGQIPGVKPADGNESNARDSFPATSSSNRGPQWNRASTNSANGNVEDLYASVTRSKVVESRSSSYMTHDQTVTNWMPHFPDSMGRSRQRSPDSSPPPPVTRRVEAYSDQSFSFSSSSSLSSPDEFRGQLSGVVTENAGTDRNSSSELREEIRNRLSSSTTSPLSGSAAVMQQRKLQNTQKPDLLGFGEPYQYNEMVSNKFYNMFTSSELDGRALHSLTYDKKCDLGVILEGGLGSPLNGKILVSTIFDDGVARKSGKMRVGDQLMLVNGVKLVDVTVTKAEFILQDAASSQDSVELLFCASTLVNEEESMTYF